MNDAAAAAPILLLVEDDDNDIVLLQRAIRRAGILVDLQFVRDGEQAMMYLSGNGMYSDRDRHPLPAIVILDLKLPRRSGHEVLKWMREQEVLRRLPVIILTSSMEPADINKSYDLGANSCLVKPITFDGLADLMRMVDAYWLNTNKPPVPDKSRRGQPDAG